MRILGIDPGNVESAYVITDENLKPLEFGKIYNEELLDNIYSGDFDKCDYVTIEKMASYGMGVGLSVFETCVWIGRFQEALNHRGLYIHYFIYRKDEKMNLCHTMKAKDSNIIQSLIDRFAPNTPNKGKGKKNNQGWFYGFKADIWQAYAVLVTYYDMYIKGDIK